MNPNELRSIINSHEKWLRNDPGGARANLSGADLSRADLYGANLSGADLSRADLYGANLSRANLYGAKIEGEEVSAWASVQFSGHGECGRTLLAIKAGESIHLRCSCFSGSPEDLRAYINSGEAKFRRTRSLALRCVLLLLKAKNDG